MTPELVMERFHRMERIGSGGMGTVYRAFDERLQREVALKEVEHADPDRVLREAQAAARLNHPSIVTLYEFGADGSRAILVSELVPGSTVAELRAAGELTDREVAEIGIDLCGALEHAHARGVVHRDIKPQNVIVADASLAGGGRRAKLMDFGIARVAGAPTLTERGQVVGTLAYMSPEQADGELAQASSDVYSLAITLYECWTGKNPVAAASPAATARRIGGVVPSLAIARPDLPEGLVDGIDACLEAEPELRPTATELLDCLEHEADDLDDSIDLADEQDARGEGDAGRSGARVAALCAAVATLALVAGPLGRPGTALALLVLAAPIAFVGVRGMVAVLGPLLAAAGVGSAASALGSAARRDLERALLGASTWAWTMTGWIALGLGPDLRIAARAPQGWATSASTAADSVLAPLVQPESLLGGLIFALASLTLGRILRVRHAAIALLAAMVWAAAVDAALSLVGSGGLGGHPVGIVLAPAGAVGCEWGLGRAGLLGWHRIGTSGGGIGLGRGRHTGRPAWM